METRSYNTIQKSNIYDMLKANSSKHMTADEMLEILKQNNIEASRATLYRYLDQLVLSGEVRKFNISNQASACYQLIDEDCKEHFHLVCEKCGKLIHLDCNKVDSLIKHIEKEHDFKINKCNIVLSGLCKDCQKDGE